MCTQLSKSPICMYHVAFLGHAQTSKFWHKNENKNTWNGRVRKASLPRTCGIENCPLVCLHPAIEVRGKNFLIR